MVISDTEKWFSLMTMVIMVIDGYQWLFMVINVYLNSAMVILVIG